MLSNDHKALTGRMEKLLHLLHAESREASGGGNTGPPARSSTEAAPGPRPASPASDVAAVPGLGQRAIAMVDEVSPGSPAAEAGVCVGDQLLQFGPVSAQTPSPLQAVSAALQVRSGGDTRGCPS